MNPQLNVVTLGVADVIASTRFYSEGLGWRPLLVVDEEVAFFQVGHGLLVALYGLDDLGTDAGEPATAGTSFSLGQNLASREEVDRAGERLQAAGGRVIKPPQGASWGGYHAYVADPDGHRWEIVHNPGLTVADDGTVTFEG